MKKSDGGSAFPISHPEHPSPSDGMTLRDWFAGQALSAVASSERYYGDDGPENIAQDAYLIADAMLAARALESEPKLNESASVVQVESEETRDG